VSSALIGFGLIRGYPDLVKANTKARAMARIEIEYTRIFEYLWRIIFSFLA
jgi:hypothetical protein